MSIPLSELIITLSLSISIIGLVLAHIIHMVRGH